jgi:thiol-disulfide isomerase/thioredoxin
MKSAYLLLPFLSLYLPIQAQQKYTIRGKIERLSKSGNIYIDQNKAPIKSDGTFEISGEVAESHVALIHTDSSGSDGLWLEAGTYTVDFREYTLPEVKPILFRAIVINGPRDAELLSDFQTRITYNNIAGQGALAIRFIDSIFQYFPNAGSLCYILVEAHNYIGDSATERYIGKLTPEMRNNNEVKMIAGEIKQNTKIRTEKSFEDFSMKTPDGEIFQLSSLKGKKAVILDFWARDCAPCRAAHPGLIELYKKYKSRGLEIVSISLDSKRDAWLDAIAKDRIDSWINVSELKGFETSLVKDYFLSYIPFHFLLDGDRKIIKIYAAGGRVSDTDIEEALNEGK